MRRGQLVGQQILTGSEQAPRDKLARQRHRETDHILAGVLVQVQDVRCLVIKAPAGLCQDHPPRPSLKHGYGEAVLQGQMR
jgi:hypothetical protein